MQALETVRLQQSDKTLKDNKKSRGFLASIFSGDSSSRNDLYLSSEFKRLPVHLEQAIVNFSGIFHVSSRIFESYTIYAHQWLELLT